MISESLLAASNESILPPIYMRKRIRFRSEKQIPSSPVPYSSSTHLSPLKLKGRSLLRPIGLSNLGNTCFLNSVLQCLLHIPQFFEIIVSSSSCQCKDSPKKPLWCISCEMAKISQRVLHYSSASIKSRISPSGIVSNLQKISTSFRYGRQEDAHEFLCVFLDAMEKYHPSLKSLTAGVFSSKIICQNCNSSFESKEPFGNISLQVSSTMEASLQRFMRAEHLDEYYKCAFCSKQGTSSRKLAIAEIPPLFILHLKRFAPGYAASKINKHVEFSERLDISPYLANPSVTTDTTYMLAGIIVHSGHSTSSGHYHACIKSQGLWYEIDDEYVSLLKSASVLSQQAYMLFYVPQSSLAASQKLTLNVVSSINPAQFQNPINNASGPVPQTEKGEDTAKTKAIPRNASAGSCIFQTQKPAGKTSVHHPCTGSIRALQPKASNIHTQAEKRSVDLLDVPLDTHDAEYDSGHIPKKGKKIPMAANIFGKNASKVRVRPEKSKRAGSKHLRHTHSTWHTQPR